MNEYCMYFDLDELSFILEGLTHVARKQKNILKARLDSIETSACFISDIELANLKNVYCLIERVSKEIDDRVC